jgi:hypothetical protein
VFLPEPVGEGNRATVPCSPGSGRNNAPGPWEQLFKLQAAGEARRLCFLDPDSRVSGWSARLLAAERDRVLEIGLDYT